MNGTMSGATSVASQEAWNRKRFSRVVAVVLVVACLTGALVFGAVQRTLAITDDAVRGGQGRAGRGADATGTVTGDEQNHSWGSGQGQGQGHRGGAGYGGGD
jgi:hypothetical protein